MECKICGKDFELKLENHYVSRDNEAHGIVNIIKNEEENIFDTFDCPYCGCQNIIQQRKRPVFVGSDYIGEIDDGYVEGVEEETEEEQEETEEESGGESTENMINCSHYHCTDCQDEPHCDWAVNDKKENVCIIEVEARG